MTQNLFGDFLLRRLLTDLRGGDLFGRYRYPLRMENVPRRKICVICEICGIKKLPRRKICVICEICETKNFHKEKSASSAKSVGQKTSTKKNLPRPDAKVEAMLAEDHIGGLDAVVTSKNTYIAPFVNAEECEYLVIEDAFPNGKPALDKGGIIFTDRATVDKVEKMKVCTCLNPLHTALAIYGCLLGYTLISEEMKNPLLKNMVEVIGYKEGLPVVVNPGILDPKKFIDEVVNVRIPNPFLPDSPQRIATDTSQKLSIRFGETIKAYEASPDLHTEDLKLIPLVYAGWLRYLMGIDDEGREFTPSSDPLLEEARQYVADYELSSAPKDLSKLDALLANEKIFGVNLHAIGMDTLVKQYFAELSSGVGAVAAALKKYVPEKVTL